MHKVLWEREIVGTRRDPRGFSLKVVIVNPFAHLGLLLLIVNSWSTFGLLMVFVWFTQIFGAISHVFPNFGMKFWGLPQSPWFLKFKLKLLRLLLEPPVKLEERLSAPSERPVDSRL